MGGTASTGGDEGETCPEALLGKEEHDEDKTDTATKATPNRMAAAASRRNPRDDLPELNRAHGQPRLKPPPGLFPALKEAAKAGFFLHCFSWIGLIIQIIPY
jgi:hypothetical protein